MQQRMHSNQRPSSWKSETQEEDGTDHTIRIEQEGKESAHEFKNGEESAMETVIKVPKSELETMGRWLINLTQQEGILEFKVLTAADMPEMKYRIQERFRVLREAEDKCIVMHSQMDDMQEKAEETLEQKDIECQQIIEQMQTECQAMIEEKEREADNDKAKLTRSLPSRLRPRECGDD